MFADACVVDAEDAFVFNKINSKFIKTPNNYNSQELIKYLNSWSKNHIKFKAIENNPKVKPLEILSENLANLSSLLLNAIEDKKLSQQNLNALNSHLKLISEPFVDVELAILKDLNALVNFCESNYLTN